MKTPMQTAAESSTRKLDLRNMLAQLKLPGIDTQMLLESGRKDIEALLETNEKVFVTAEKLTRMQADLLSEMVKEWQAGLRDAVSKSSATEKVNQTTNHAQQALTSALTSMKEMAEITAKSNQEVLNILNKRYHEGLQELRSSIRRAPAPKDSKPDQAE